jgi:hypothetical protein
MQYLLSFLDPTWICRPANLFVCLVTAALKQNMYEKEIPFCCCQTIFFGQDYRVTRWFVFKPQIPIWVNFGGPLNDKCCYILWSFGIFYGHLALCMATWLSLWSHVVYFSHFGTFRPRKIWQPWPRIRLCFVNKLFETTFVSSDESSGAFTWPLHLCQSWTHHLSFDFHNSPSSIATVRNRRAAGRVTRLGEFSPMYVHRANFYFGLLWENYLSCSPQFWGLFSSEKVMY